METLRLFRSKMDYRVGSVKSYFVCFLILSPISVCLVQCKDEGKLNVWFFLQQKHLKTNTVTELLIQSEF